MSNADKHCPDLDLKLFPVILEKALDNLGLPKNYTQIGGGACGMAYLSNNRVYKITTDKSEAIESNKLVGKTNQYIANVFNVKRINTTLTNVEVFLIVLEYLDIGKSSIFAEIEEELQEMVKIVFNENLFDIIYTYQRDPTTYHNDYADGMQGIFDTNHREKFYYNSLLKIVDELKANNIDSLDIQYHNLGLKPNGNLAFFDLGFGDTKDTHLGSMDIGEGFDYVNLEKDKNFKFTDDLGGEATGFITDDMATIISMNSVPFKLRYSDEAPNYKRRGFFKSLIHELKKQGVKTLKISLQSSDTQKAAERLLNIGILKNPTDITGSSGNEHPTKFEISERVKSYMKNSSAVKVADKCKFGGNADGTSNACNKGDISNFNFSRIDERRVKKDERDDIYRDGEVIIVRPLTFQASCKYGAHTSWCTSAPSNEYIWSNDPKSVLIYIIQKNYHVDPEKEKNIGRFLELKDKEDNGELTDENEIEEYQELAYRSDVYDLSKIAISMNIDRISNMAIFDANNVEISDLYDSNYYQLPINDNAKEAIHQYVMNQKESFGTIQETDSDNYRNVSDSVLEDVVSYLENLTDIVKPKSGTELSSLLKTYLIGSQNIDKALEKSTNDITFYNNLMKVKDVLKRFGLMVESPMLNEHTSRWNKMLQRKWTELHGQEMVSPEEMEVILRKEKAITVSEEDIRAVVEYELANLVNEKIGVNLPQSGIDGFKSFNIMNDDQIVGSVDLAQRDNGYLILDRIFVDDEYRGMGYADKALKLVLDYADRNNLILTLTPDNTWGSSVGKLTSWYKSHGFVLNKGKNKDFQTMQLMYRLPKNNNMIAEEQVVDLTDLPFKSDVEKAGGKLYSVGGAVRDRLLGKESKDLDILITGIPLDQLESILSKHGKVDNVGKSFGIIKFKTPQTGEIDIAIPRFDKNKQGFLVRKGQTEVFIKYGGLNYEEKKHT